MIQLRHSTFALLLGTAAAAPTAGVTAVAAHFGLVLGNGHSGGDGHGHGHTVETSGIPVVAGMARNALDLLRRFSGR